MRNAVVNKPLKIIVSGDNQIKRNILSHYIDVVEEQTLMLISERENDEGQLWVIEEFEKTNTYFIRAYGKLHQGRCITALKPDFTWQSLMLEEKMKCVTSNDGVFIKIIGFFFVSII